MFKENLICKKMHRHLDKVLRSYIPTTAFLLPAEDIKEMIKPMLNPQTMILAMLASEPSAPTLSIPHSALIPTGAI
jgi:hypothetical protein